LAFRTGARLRSSHKVSAPHDGRRGAWRCYIEHRPSGHLTPTGVFTVLQKQKEHRSAIRPTPGMPSSAARCTYECSDSVDRLSIFNNLPGGARCNWRHQAKQSSIESRNAGRLGRRIKGATKFFIRGIITPITPFNKDHYPIYQSQFDVLPHSRISRPAPL
jgi:hypothetical protein